MKLRSLISLVIIAVGLTACSLVKNQDRSAQQLPVGFAVRTLTYSLPDGSPRTITIDIWYPARPAQATPTDSATQGAAGVTPDSDALRPLLIFSHGNGGKPTDYSRILTYFAGQGYVVAAPEHQDCPSKCSDAQFTAETMQRPLDVRSTLDEVLSLNASQEDVLHNLIDTAHVGIAGQSFGGWTALQAMQADSRFQAALVMNPATQIRPMPDATQVSRPVMMMVGELDALVPFAANEDFFARTPSTADRWLLVVPNAGHEFGNICFPSAATIACSSMLPQDRLINLIQSVGTQFLNRYVGGASSSLDDVSTPDYTVMHTPAGQPTQPMPTAVPLDASPAPTATPSPADVVVQLPAVSVDPNRYSAGYGSDGAYDIAIHQAFTQGEALVPGTYLDATISVDAQLMQPRDDQYVQLACREREPTTEYRFGFDPSTGMAWINRWYRMTGGPPVTVLVETYTSPVPDGSTFHMSLECIGTRIVGAVNGATVVSASDKTLTSGQFWVAVGEVPGGAHPEVLAEAKFTNLVVMPGSG